MRIIFAIWAMLISLITYSDVSESNLSVIGVSKLEHDIINENISSICQASLEKGFCDSPEDIKDHFLGAKNHGGVALLVKQSKFREIKETKSGVLVIWSVAPLDKLKGKLSWNVNYTACEIIIIDKKYYFKKSICFNEVEPPFYGDSDG